MINATEMALAFKKDLFQFTKREDTIAFIDACLKPANAGLYNGQLLRAFWRLRATLLSNS